MKKPSRRTADPSEPSPPPSIEATRKAIADAVIRESIALYHQARRARDRFDEVSGGDPALDNVSQVITDRLVDAENNLILAILVPGQGHGFLDPRCHLYPSRGVRCDGLLYLARPSGSDEDHADGGRMELSIVDESRIAEAGTIADLEVYRPDWSPLEHVTEWKDGPAS
jgi:hypothetical protein